MSTEKIERYINQEMGLDERNAFELELKNNSSLTREVEQMAAVIKQLKLASLSAKIKEAQKLNHRASQNKTYGIVALICAALICMMFYFFSKTEKPSSTQNPPENITVDTSQLKELQENDNSPTIKNPENKQPDAKAHNPKLPMAEFHREPENNKGRELAMNAYFSPEELVYVRGKSVESMLDSAKLAFNNEKYSKALNYLTNIPESSTKSDYFKAHIYFNLGQFDRAGKLFEKVMVNEPVVEKREEIEWYLLLNSLACGTKCNTVMDQIFLRITQNPNHSFYKSAAVLKKRIEEK